MARQYPLLLVGRKVPDLQNESHNMTAVCLLSQKNWIWQDILQAFTRQGGDAKKGF